MKESLVNRLRAQRKELIEKICKFSIDEHFWSQLTENGTITSEHVCLCKVENTDVKKIELLLDMLERRDDSCFQKFCQVLRIHDKDIVKKYLEFYVDAPTLSSTTQLETGEELNDMNILHHLQYLKEINASMLKQLNEDDYDQLEIINANMQVKLEEAKHEVHTLESQHEENEKKYEDNVVELADEKILIEELEKERDVMEEEISHLEKELNEKKEIEKKLIDELSEKTRENKKLGRQISVRKTQLSSLGSRSFSEDC